MAHRLKSFYRHVYSFSGHSKSFFMGLTVGAYSQRGHGGHVNALLRVPVDHDRISDVFMAYSPRLASIRRGPMVSR